jgi:hypothetical protein
MGSRPTNHLLVFSKAVTESRRCLISKDSAKFNAMMAS